MLNRTKRLRICTARYTRVPDIMPEYPSSFYISNDQWMKGEEITYLPNQKRIDRKIPLMDKIKLSSYIDDPHQKFYYTFNFDRPFDFHVELKQIILNDTPGATYPLVVRSVGEAPKQFGNVFNSNCGRCCSNCA
jgi:hypothetical protein